MVTLFSSVRPPDPPLLLARLAALLALIALLSGWSAAQTQLRLQVTPNPVTLGQPVTALLTPKAATAPSPGRISWGDGDVEPTPAAPTSLPHTYSRSGSFTVSWEDQSVTVVVSPPAPPAPVLSVTPNSGPVGTEVSVDIQNLPPTAGLSLNWGDGSPPVSASASQKHVYTAAGTFSVILRAVTGAPVGQAVVQITPPAPPPAPPPILNVNPTSGPIGTEVSAEIQNLPPTGGLSLTWGDGSPPVLASASQKHIYADAGTFTVLLKGASGVPVGQAVVQIVPPVQLPVLTVTPTSGPVGSEVTASIQNLAATSPFTLTWGDGSPPIPASASQKHVYTSVGVFTVLLRGASGAPVGQATVQITQPAATLTLSPPSVVVGQPVSAALTNLLPGDTLDWGDASGPVPAAPALTHAYAAPGVYAVRLLRTAPGAAQPITAAVGSVNVGLTPATLALTPSSVKQFEEVIAELGSLTPSVSYTLDWADGSIDQISGVSQAVRKHKYAAPGTYPVKLSTAGQPTASVPVVVTAALTFAPVLTLSPEQVPVNTSITAEVGNLDPNLSYTLEWGDGSTFTISDFAKTSVKHRYAQGGRYTVKVAAPGGPPAVAVATANYLCSLSVDTSPVVFKAPTSFTLAAVPAEVGSAFPPGTPFEIDWGDNSPSTSGSAQPSQILKHTFDKPGPVVISVRPTELVGGLDPAYQPSACSATVNVEVPNPTLTGQGQPAGTPSDVQAGNLVFGPGAPVVYRLDYGDGTPPEEFVPTKTDLAFKHVYAQPGTYLVKLIQTVLASTPKIVATTTLIVPANLGETTSAVILAAEGNAPPKNIPAPTSVTIKEGAGAKATVNIQSATVATVNVRWTLTDVTPSQILPSPPKGSLPKELEVLPVTLIKGPNAVSINLPTTPAGSYLLTAQVRPLVKGPGGQDSAGPPSFTSVQPITIVKVVPKVLVVGTGLNQFRFTVTDLFLGNQKPGSGTEQAPTSFDPSNFWATLTLETPLNLDGVSTDGSEFNITVRRAQVTLQGETAVLTKGEVLAENVRLAVAGFKVPQTSLPQQDIKLAGGNLDTGGLKVSGSSPPGPSNQDVLGGLGTFDPNSAKEQTSGGGVKSASLEMPAAPLTPQGVTQTGTNAFDGELTLKDTLYQTYTVPSLSPMRLKFDVIRFTPEGATLRKPVLAAPDYSQASVTGTLSEYLAKLAKLREQLAKSVKDKADSMILQSKPTPLDLVSQQLQNQLFTPVSTQQIQQKTGTVGPPRLMFALAKPNDTTALAQAADLPNAGALSLTGSGYGQFKGASALEQAAGKGVSVGLRRQCRHRQWAGSGARCGHQKRQGQPAGGQAGRPLRHDGAAGRTGDRL
jgi:hypothetical protein